MAKVPSERSVRGTAGRQRGQVLALTIFALLALCGLVGLAADLGYSFDDRRRAQTAADAAALAGAQELRRGGNGGIVAAGNDGATANGFTNGANGATVTINNPPTSGYYANNPSFVEAIVTRSHPTLFMGILGIPTGKVSARAVAGAQVSDNCIYALSRTGTGIGLGGSSSSLSAACGIVVDSSDSPALNAGPGTVFGKTVAVTGSISGTCTTMDPLGCRSGVPPEPDPLATRATPQFGSCDFGQTNPVHVNGGVVALNPGVYCDGISVNSGATVTFTPGLYVLNGGGLSVGGNSTVKGSGVTFYLTATTGHTYEPLSLAGGTLGFLSAPTSGPYEGMLFFQDRTIIPKSSKATNGISGSSNLSLEGILYFPTTDVTFTGGGQLSVEYTIIVANTITISGNTTLSANYSKLQSGNPIKTASLGE